MIFNDTDGVYTYTFEYERKVIFMFVSTCKFILAMMIDGIVDALKFSLKIIKLGHSNVE